jgi:small subunit ribosomal protein S17
VSETENENTEQVDETAETEPTSAAEPEAPTAPAASGTVPEGDSPAEPTAAVPEPAAEEPAETGAEAAEAPQGTVPSGDSPQRKRSRKHVPRSERRQRPRRQRASTGERKPVQREPKPESDRGRRQERRGVVVSSAMDKTIVVKVDVLKVHPRYKKVIRRSQKFHAHDEQHQANVGDVVRIVETRPLSKTKNWRLAEVVEVAR